MGEESVGDRTPQCQSMKAEVTRLNVFQMRRSAFTVPEPSRIRVCALQGSVFLTYGAKSKSRANKEELQLIPLQHLKELRRPLFVCQDRTLSVTSGSNRHTGFSLQEMILSLKNRNPACDTHSTSSVRVPQSGLPNSGQIRISHIFLQDNLLKSPSEQMRSGTFFLTLSEFRALRLHR